MNEIPAVCRPSEASNCIKTQVRAERAWLELTSEFSIRCGDRNVDHKLVAAVDLLEKIDIAKDKAGLGHDSRL